MRVAKIRMLRWMDTLNEDTISNECIRNKVGIAPIDDKMRETRLRLFGHVHKRPLGASVQWVNREL